MSIEPRLYFEVWRHLFDEWSRKPLVESGEMTDEQIDAALQRVSNETRGERITQDEFDRAWNRAVGGGEAQ